jgi:pyrimidine operon attenuation protein/uracil phosphoribosyltransferase
MNRMNRSPRGRPEAALPPTHQTDAPPPWPTGFATPSSPPHSHSRVLDGEGIVRAVTRVAHEIGERHSGDLDRVVIAGIREGGLAVAHVLADRGREVWGRRVPLVAVDVSGFRDDRPRQPGMRSAWQPVAGNLVPSPAGMVVVLVDDVIQTGRTMRAALDLVMSRGRPAAIEVAVLVDRGGREIPVRPNHVGKNLPVAPGAWVEIRLEPRRAEAGVYLVPRR